MTGRISFRKIEEIRVDICPEASKASSILGLAKAWPTPCVLIEATLDHKQKTKDLRGQAAMPFRDAPKKDLRVTSVRVNDPARLSGMRLHRNWRVPRESSLYRTFEGDDTFIQTALQNAADIEPTDNRLLITLAPLSSPHRSRVLEALCEVLEQNKDAVPGHSASNLLFGCALVLKQKADRLLGQNMSGALNLGFLKLSTGPRFKSGPRLQIFSLHFQLHRGHQ